MTIDHLERSFEQGLRAIGPAHYGPGTYAYGTDSIGPIGVKGKELLKKTNQAWLSDVESPSSSSEMGT